MSTEILNKDMTVKAVLDRWPETLDVFVANGFENFTDEKQRNAVATYLKLERAAQTKNYDLDNFIGLLQDRIDEQQNQVDVTMKTTQKSDSSVNICGLLPCPVRLPLLEGFDAFIENYTAETGNEVSYKLEAASVGADWIEENIQGIDDAADLPDLFLSAGFETFFDQKTIGRFKTSRFSPILPAIKSMPTSKGWASRIRIRIIQSLPLSRRFSWSTMMSAVTYRCHAPGPICSSRNMSSRSHCRLAISICLMRSCWRFTKSMAKKGSENWAAVC